MLLVSLQTITVNPCYICFCLVFSLPLLESEGDAHLDHLKQLHDAAVTSRDLFPCEMRGWTACSTAERAIELLDPSFKKKYVNTCYIVCNATNKPNKNKGTLFEQLFFD